MTFNQEFFDELRCINQSDLGAIIPGSIRPRVSELKAAGLVTPNFAAVLEILVRKLHKKRKSLAFNADFVAYPGHICTFPDGLAFRRQLNTGFFAGDTPDNDGIRFGLGFSINKNFSQTGVDEYTDFLVKVVSAPENFDEFIEKVGGYAEPDLMHTVSPMSLSITENTPDYDGDWRFFGRYLSWRNDRDIVSDMELLVEEMIKVFELIAGYRF